MSRKLLFTNGLATCFSCKLYPPEILGGEFSSDEQYSSAIAEHLLKFSEKSPLENVAEAMIQFEANEAAKLVFGAYNDFLGILSDPTSRDALDTLSVDDAAENALFQKARDIGHQFQDGLTKFFFETNDELTKCSKRYGVF